MVPFSGGLARIVILGGLSAVLALAAFAQGQESREKQGPRSRHLKAAADTTVKKALLLLFPRHRRGVYKNTQGRFVIDATPQSPPLETDDPGVPDKGEYEINLVTRADFSKELRAFDFLLVDANYGFLPKVFGHPLPTQLKIEFPLAGAKPPGDPMQVGIGAAKVGLKLNFYEDEHKGISASLYPQMAFAVPGTDGVDKGLAEPGQTFILPLLVQKELKHLTIVANGVLDQPIHDSARSTTGTLALGVGRAMTPRVALMAEGRFTSTFDLERERLVVLNFGLMRRLRNNVGLYANVGRSLFSDEGFEHTYAGIGVKFEFTPKE